MLLSVQRSQIFNEFTPEEQKYWFGIKEKAVAHHVDSLYYTVSIKGDKRDNNDPMLVGDWRDEKGKRILDDNGKPILGLLPYLEDLKIQKRMLPSSSVTFHCLEVSVNGGGQIYCYRLQMPEKYDIYFARDIMNDDTPRIQVQLRTHALVLDGLFSSIEDSLAKVRDILFEYNQELGLILETRIDYAFHTNCIQKPMEIIGTESLNQHLVTSFNRFGLQGNVAHRFDENLELDYFTLGSRKADYLFFRAYEKTKEVIQMNYKGFFFEIWRQRGLISRYDQFVFEQAYILGGYRTGLLVGRVKWYLEHGKNEELKTKLSELLVKYYEKSSNNTFLEKEIKGILPPTTKIFNLEFESKRKFYTYYDKYISRFRVILADDASSEAGRLYTILGMRREFIDKLLTKYVSFVKNRCSNNLEEQDWWRRIRCCRIKDIPDETKLNLVRHYARNLDMNRQAKSIAGNIASIATLYRRDTNDFDFSYDVIDALTFLNDNDKVDFSGLKGLSMPEYKGIKMRKARQLMPIIKKMDIEPKTSENEENENTMSLQAEDNELIDDTSLLNPFGELLSEDGYLNYNPSDYSPDEYRVAEHADYHYYGDAWRCIRCGSVKYGDKDLFKMLDTINVYPYHEGICKRCQRIFGKHKK